MLYLLWAFEVQPPSLAVRVGVQCLYFYLSGYAGTDRAPVVMGSRSSNLYAIEAWHEECASGWSEEVILSFFFFFLNWRLFTGQLQINMLINSVQEKFTQVPWKNLLLQISLFFSAFRGSIP